LTAKQAYEVQFNAFLTFSGARLINAAANVRSSLDIMSDLIFVGIVAAFFLVSGLYVRFCEKL